MDATVEATIKVNLERRYFKKDLSESYNKQEVVECDEIEANLIGSKTNVDDMHLLMLDLDFPCILQPSSTKGHFHLFLQKSTSWKQAVDLLIAMQNAGFLEQGWVANCIEEGMTSVRVPGLKK